MLSKKSRTFRLNDRKCDIERLEARNLMTSGMGADDRSLTLTSWANGATVDGSGTWDTLVLHQDANFTLRSGSVSSGGKTLYYRNFDNVRIEGGQSANQFTLLPGFDTKIPGTLSFDAGGGSDSLNLGGNQGLSRDIKLYQSPSPSVQNPSTLEIDRRVVRFVSRSELPEKLSIRGTDRDNTYKIVNYSGEVKIDGAGGVDSVTLGGNAANIKLILSATSNRVEMGASKNRLFNLEKMQVEGGSANQTFEIQGNVKNWESVAIVGGDGKDIIKAAMPDVGGFIRRDILFLSQVGEISLNGLESFKITGNDLDQKFLVDNWPGDGLFDGRDGRNTLECKTDQFIAHIDRDSIDLGALTDQSTGEVANRIAFRSISYVKFDASESDDMIDCRQFPGLLSVFGNAGNDIILGSRTNQNNLDGGPGSDWIVGGELQDYLYGGDGRDILIGRKGTDEIVGADDQDIIIGGSTSYDDDIRAMQNLLLFWSEDLQKFGAADAKGIPTSGRIHSVFHDGIEILPSSGKYYLRTAVPGSTLPATVFDDGEVDTIFDASRDEAADWYFLNLVGNTSAKDIFANEDAGNVVTEL